MSITKIDDYSDFNKPPYLMEQFRGTDLESLLGVIDQQFNELESAIYDMLTSVTDLDEAVGEQLDVLGIHLGLDRNDRLDDLYRSLLKTKVYIDTSGGVAETIIDAIKMLYEATEIHYTASGKNIVINQDGLIGLLTYANIRLDDDSFLVDFYGNSLVFSSSDDGAVTILESVIPTGTSLTVNKIDE